MTDHSHNVDLSGESPVRKLSAAQLAALAKARATKLQSGRPLKIAKIAVPIPRFGRLFRAHVKTCPFRKLGRRHVDCDCPVYLGEGRDVDGKKINAQSLHTRDWQQGREREAVLESGAPLGSIGDFSKIFRKHEKTCPYRGKGGVSHRDCDCTVWIHGYKAGPGKYGVGKRASLAYTRSLYTRDWQHACDLANDSARGVPLGTIQLLGRLFRQHEKTCPFFGKQGVSYLECTCNVWTSAYKVRDASGKLVWIRKHTLRTRIWEDGRKQLVEWAAPGGLAQKKERDLKEERRSRDVRLRPYLDYVLRATGSSASCRVKLADIAADVGVPVATATDNIRLARELGYVDTARHGRLKTFTFTLTVKGRDILSGHEPPSAKSRPGSTKYGRPTADATLRVFARWVELGKPSLEAGVADELAKQFFATDFSKARLYSPQRRKLRDRIRAIVRRHSNASGK